MLEATRKCIFLDCSRFCKCYLGYVLHLWFVCCDFVNAVFHSLFRVRWDVRPHLLIHSSAIYATFVISVFYISCLFLLAFVKHLTLSSSPGCYILTRIAACIQHVFCLRTFSLSRRMLTRLLSCRLRRSFKKSCACSKQTSTKFASSPTRFCSRVTRTPFALSSIIWPLLRQDGTRSALLLTNQYFFVILMWYG